MKKISLDSLKIILTPPEMKNVLGGSGCCYYRCGDPWFEGITELDQDACWIKMERECNASFTIQPC